MVDRRKYFQPGDLIYTCEPFVSIVRSEVLREYCEGCFKRGLNLKRCASCKYVSYCGTKCQKKSWQEHQRECKYLHNLPKVGRDYIRILGKIILKLKGGNLKDISDQVGPHRVSFDELTYDSRAILTPAEENLRYLQYANLLKDYLGENMMPQEPVLRKIIDKTFENLEQMKHLNVAKFRLELYIGMFMFAHSCIPNAVCIPTGNKREIRATAEIPKSNWKSITLSRTFVVDLGNPMINPVLKNCKCSDCSAPYGESLLTKILDKKKAFFVMQESRDFLNLMHTAEQLKVDVVDGSLKTNTLLQKQEGILADTHILRLRLLYVKCIYCVNDPYELKVDLKKLVHLLERVFGKNSVELVTPVLKLQQLNFQLGCTNEAIECTKKLENIKKIQTGQRTPMAEAAANVPIDFQNFLRDIFTSGQHFF